MIYVLLIQCIRLPWDWSKSLEQSWSDWEKFLSRITAEFWIRGDLDLQGYIEFKSSKTSKATELQGDGDNQSVSKFSFFIFLALIFE